MLWFLPNMAGGVNRSVQRRLIGGVVGGPRVSLAQVELVREGLRRGSSVAELAVVSGVSRGTVRSIRTRYGGIGVERRCRRLGHLTAADGEKLRSGVDRGLSFAEIGRLIGKYRSTVSREIGRNGGRARYRGVDGERRAAEKARRPKVSKIGGNKVLLEAVVHWLMLGRSPQQVARELREQFPSREEMWVSHETIIRVSTSSLEAYSAKS
jgi:hypothetical protein